MTRRELLTWPFSEVNVSHPHVTVDGTRISAEAAGCDANWHMYPDSGHSDNGSGACGGTFFAASGSFTDGSAASADYGNSVTCRWVIRPQVGPGRYRSPRHSTYFGPTLLEVNESL